MKDAYLEIADRSLKAAKACHECGVGESCAFYSYHAFESAGGAFIEHLGLTYPLSHDAKLRRFTAESQRIGKQWEIAHLAITLKAFRNAMLYPEKQPDGTVSTPSDKMSKTDAGKLRSRSNGIVKLIRKNT